MKKNIHKTFTGFRDYVDALSCQLYSRQDDNKRICRISCLVTKPQRLNFSYDKKELEKKIMFGKSKVTESVLSLSLELVT